MGGWVKFLTQKDVFDTGEKRKWLIQGETEIDQVFMIGLIGLN